MVLLRGAIVRATRTKLGSGSTRAELSAVKRATPACVADLQSLGGASSESFGSQSSTCVALGIHVSRELPVLGGLGALHERDPGVAPATYQIAARGPGPMVPSVMHFSDFIEQNRERIIREWVCFATEQIPSSKGMNEEALRDHADELLRAVVDDMKTPQTGAQTHDKSQGLEDGGKLASVGHRHASQRLEGGFDLGHLLSEYRALRASVLRLWAEAHGEDHVETTRFSEAIDESLTASILRYSQTLQRTREQFLAMLGHDLRSPLSAVTMGAAALARAEELDDAHARIATRILSSAHRMSRMIADLLDFTRTRLGEEIPIVPRPTDLGLVCRAIIEEHEVVHPDCRLRLLTRGDLVGEWDGDRLTQVVSNLVANAIHHGKQHGEVTVCAEDRGDRVQVRVHNMGEPISESALRHIFEPLVRGPSGDGNRNATGLGLGLYIAQQIVTAHDGTIDVTSTAEDGTTFVVDLPRRAPTPE